MTLSNFRQTRFLGASVSSITSNVGWNEQSGSLTVTLVEDISALTTKHEWALHQNGQAPIVYGSTAEYTDPDHFQELLVGTPVHFRFEDFIFNGILQSWEKKKSFSGFYYEVVINSPTEILGNVELIIGGFNGSVGGIANLMNIYGFYENIQFGSSLVNEAGMPWPTVKAGLLTLSELTGTYSGGIYFKGVPYRLDLSNLPLAPQYYRIQGNSVNALQVISQLCQDSGYDYIVKLDYVDGYGVIKFITVNRGIQPDITALRAFIDARTDASSKNRGIELRNEVSSAFVVGGYLERLWRMTGDLTENTIWPYWGLDADGNAVIGTGTNDGHIFTLDSRAVNCPGVGATYECTVGEIRAVLANMDSWLAYITLTNPDRATLLGIPNYFGIDQVETANLFKEGKGNAIRLPNTSEAWNTFANDNDKKETIFNLFNFLNNVAQEFYGKKFLVSVDDLVQIKIEPDTERVITSYEPSDGGYLERTEWLTGSQPLDLPYAYKDIFTQEDGRYVTFVKFNNASTYDLKDLPPDATIVVDDVLYLKCDTEQFLVYRDVANYTYPYAIVTLPGPVNSKEEDSRVWGQMLLVVRAVMVADEADPLTTAPTSTHIDNAYKICKTSGNTFAGNFPVSFGAFANIPQSACVPLRSNKITYGPWFSIGLPGKVRYEQDTELVPWNFNGYTFMDNAGNSKVVDVSAAQQIGEMGSIELVGSPEVQLGEALVVGGPSVTGIDISCSTAGVTTNYRMRTYTPTFGGFAKANADRLQRLSRTARDNERKILANRRSMSSVPGAFFAARERALLPIKGPSYDRSNSPHGYIGMRYADNEDIDGGKMVLGSTMTIEELKKGIDAEHYNVNSVSSLDALFRPYSVKYDTEEEISHFQTPLGIDIKTVEDFNPFNYSLDEDGTPEKQGDVELAAYGDEYPTTGLQSRLIENQDEEDVRLIGFKGPMVLTGWGYDIFGKPVPNSAEDETLPILNGDEFEENFRQKPHLWKSGPVNLRWNPINSMWDTPHKMMIGTLNKAQNDVTVYKITSGGSISALLDENGNKIHVPLTAWYSASSIPSGTKLIITMVDERAIIVSSEC